MKRLGKKTCFVSLCLLIAMVALAPIAMLETPRKAQAASNATEQDYTFTLIQNAQGESEYKVAIKATSRPSIKTAIIPEEHEGIPVTEIADSGFLSCAQLEKVILPTSVKKIGMNAFMNCPKLQRVSLPSVESIGNNAFGMCTTLDRLYIPKSVKTVGSTILRNNSKTVYIQSAATDLNGWSVNWNDYHTGNVEYEARPEATITYREIKDTSNNVIGYELCDEFISAPLDDVVIYSSYSPDPVNVPYKPILNIYPNAFTLSYAKSLTIKHRSDPALGVFDHKINIMSEAFAYTFIDKINIEVDVTFDHPDNLQGSPIYSNFDGHLITNDGNGKANNLFYESTIKSVTLPDKIDFVTDKMFFNCAYLSKIALYNHTYNGENHLPSINKIGNEAFTACISLDNIYISEEVSSVGNAIFNSWGDGENNQIININVFEDEAITGLDKESISATVNLAKVTINYKALISVTLDLNDESGNKIVIGAKLGKPMPAISKPSRIGWEFKGFYLIKDGERIYYYNENAESARNWDINEASELTADWIINTYTIKYDVDLKGLTNPNPTTYTVKMLPLTFTKLSLPGWEFNWQPAYLEENTTGDKTVKGDWKAIPYSIRYDVDLKGLTNPNDTTYTVEMLPLIFTKLSLPGWEFNWQPAYLDKDTTGDQVVKGNWKAIEYPINYDVDLRGWKNPNPQFYTVEMLPLTFKEISDYGYNFYWNPAYLDKDTTGPQTVKGTWEIITYTINYKVEDWKGLSNPNPLSFTIKDLPIHLQELSSPGYSFKWNIPEIATLGDKTIIGSWNNNRYTINLDANGGTLPSSTKQVMYNYLIGSLSTPTWSGHAFLGWNTDRYGQGTSVNANTNYTWANDIVLYAQWEYTIRFDFLGETFTPIKGAYGTVVELPFTTQKRTGYTFNRWGFTITESKNYVITGDAVLKGAWTPKDREVRIKYIQGSADEPSTVKDSNGNSGYSFTAYYDINYEIAAPNIEGLNFIKWEIKYTYPKIVVYHNPNYDSNQTTHYQLDELAVTADVKHVYLYAVYGSGCVADGTLITLADGSQKTVETLTTNDLLLVWNLRTGSFDTAPILFIDKEVENLYKVINLYFSDGTQVKVISEHGFWDIDLNKYVFLREDADKFIGHRFNKQTTNQAGEMTWAEVRLVDVVIAMERTSSWSPVTADHLCYYVNGMLSIPGATTGLVNIFEVDSTTMSYDEESMQADIEQYGLFTYEEFAAIFPVPQEIFNAFNAQYFKISIGKGLIDYETLGALIKRYAKFF